MAKKRITQLATETTLKDGQYVAIDHTTDGTKKLNLGAELTDLKEDFETLETEVSTLTDAVTLSAYNTDKTPYLFRASGGDKYIGGIEKDSIVGGTVEWNQLCNGLSVTVQNGHKYYMIKGGTASIGASTGSAITGLTGGIDIVSDLTLMFGSTIADYIYSLEQTTAGSGVAKLKEWGFFTEDYYAYDSGSLKSVEGLEAHITRDADENIIGNYPLDSDLTLRGIPKLDSSNNLYYDGDIYRADGSVARNYGIVDLGTLNYTAYTSQGISYFYTSALSSLAKKPSTQFQKANIICKYPTGTLQDLTTLDKYIWLFTNGNLCIKDTAYSDAATFKASLSGVYLVYELATSTTETADPYQNPQLVDKDGTEEYVTTGIVPVGHDTEYYLDADSVLTPPSTTGTYSLKVTVASDGSKSYSWVSD